MEMTLSKLACLIGGEIAGDGDRKVVGVAPLKDAGENDVSFLANAKYLKHMSETRAAAVIVAEDYEGPGPALIRCKDPYFAFRQAMVEFYGFRRPDFQGVDSRANIHPDAEVSDDASVAPFVTISDGCKISSGAVIYPGAYIGANCRIGTDCVIHPNVTLYDGTVLHDRVIIHAGTSVGQDGFGYATHAGDDGVTKHYKIPQIGWVEIEDDVEIGACCAIDRATMGPTIIGSGTKISNLVAVGHGTRLGEHCLLVAQAGIAGSTMVGNYCVFAGQSGVVGHIRIGDGVRVGAKAGVTKDVKPGQEVLGSPAMPLGQARRALLSLSQLPQLREAFRRLNKDVAALKDHILLRKSKNDKNSNNDREK